MAMNVRHGNGVTTPRAGGPIVDIINLSSSANTLLRERVLAMRAIGVDNRIICMDGPYVQPLRDAGVPVETARLPRGLNPVKVVVSLIEIVRYLRREKPDLVHTHCSVPGLIGRLAARLAGVPVVFHTVHGFHFHDGSRGPTRWFYVWIERLAGLLTDRLLSQNRADMEQALRYGIVPAARLQYIGNGVALERFQPPASRPASEDGVIITCVARMEAVKNHMLLLEAARLLKARGERFQVWLVGGGELRAQYEAMSEDWGLSANIRFLGYRDDIPGLLAQSDIGVLTSLKEGIPRAVLEAMAMSLPVVATRVSGTREVVCDGESGFLVEPDDVHSLASALSRLIADPALRTRLGARGRELVVERFNEADIVRNLERYYRDGLMSKGIPVPSRLAQVVEA